jgi:hypothetical protein
MSSAVNVSRINGITRVKVLPHFYLIEKVISTPWQSIAIKLNQVKVSLIPELFGEVFIWWYVNFFEKQFLPVYRDCSTGKQISIGKQIIDLRNWLDLHSNKSELYEWTQKALRDYERKMNIQN